MSAKPASPESDPQEWLRFASSDLALARVALNEPDVFPSQAGFHAQQAAEKAIKAVLLHRAISVPKTHDLDVLIELWCQAGHEWPEAFDGISEMTVFAVRARYPGDIDPPTRGEVAMAVKLAEQIFAWAANIIGLPGQAHAPGDEETS